MPIIIMVAQPAIIPNAVNVSVCILIYTDVTFHTFEELFVEVKFAILVIFGKGLNISVI
jgi:hypothetical protein